LFQLIDSKKVLLKKFEYEGGDREGGDSGVDRFTHDTGPLTDFPSTYIVRVTSKSPNQCLVTFGLGGVGSWNFVTGTAVPIRIMNNAFRMAIQALGISGRAERDKIFLSFGAELERFVGLDSAILGEHTLDLPDNIDIDASLSRFDGKICTTAEVVKKINDRFNRDMGVVERRFTNPNNPNGPKLSGFEDAKKKVEAWRDDQMSFAKPENLNILLTTAATIRDADVEIDLKVGSINIDLADFSTLSVNVILSFHPTLRGQRGFVFCPDKINGGLIELLEDLGIISVDRMIEERIETFFLNTFFRGAQSSVIQEIGKYLAEVLTRTARGFDTFVSATRNNGILEVKSLDRPVKGHGGITIPVAQPPSGNPTGGVGSGGSIGGGSIGGGSVGGGSVNIEGSGSTVQPSTDPAPTTLGVLPDPALFKVGSEQSLARLDRIQRIVVVMMENRSFDHYLGYLHASRPEIDGRTGAVNRVTLESGQVIDVHGLRAVEVFSEPGLPPNIGLTGPLSGPDHRQAAVKDQIADGAMSGFAQNFTQFNSQNQEAAMCFYDAASLPTYHMFANEFLVCNRWFAAHPGPTFPNRWATICGTIPAEAIKTVNGKKIADNMSFKDDRLGFLKGNLIFESLTSIGIPWKVYEGNYSAGRMFEKFRLNDSNIVSIKDPTDGLDADITNNRFPQVAFIEPTFTGLPPVSIAEDDQPPINIFRGQSFVSDIYNKLEAAHLLRDTLFIVTYDEHGGFYDHVPPPGTRLGPPANSFASLYSGGPQHLGVRVPSFLISGFVQAGSVYDGILDHTCIIKTILLKYRRKLSTNDFVRYGERVMGSGHLGEALNLDTPRTSFPRAPSQKRNITMRFGSMVPKEKDDFAAGLAFSMMPRNGRK